jgi:Family of unknown function (DUF6011)
MMSIRCGKCQGRHESVADVKACYAGRTATATATDHRSNRYAGPCALCGNNVPEGEGRIERRDGGNGWTVLHLSGQCPEAKASANGAKRVVGPTSRDFSAVAGGYYATVNTLGTNDYDFWYVKEGRKPGYRFVKRVLGGQGPIRITGAEAIRALQAILAEGIDVCGNRFADEMERCRDCGLPLTDEISRRERRGPVCRSK